MSMKLYELSPAYKSILDRMDDDVELTEEEWQAAIETEQDLNAKAENTALMCASLGAEIEAMKDAEGGIRSRRKSKEDAREWLRRYTAHWMVAADKLKVKGLFATVSATPPKAKVIPTHPEDLPDNLIIWEGTIRIGRPATGQGLAPETIKDAIDAAMAHVAGFEGQAMLHWSPDFLIAEVQEYFNQTGEVPAGCELLAGAPSLRITMGKGSKE